MSTAAPAYGIPPDRATATAVSPPAVPPAVEVLDSAMAWDEYFDKSRNRMRKYQIIAHPIMVYFLYDLCVIVYHHF